MQSQADLEWTDQNLKMTEKLLDEKEGALSAAQYVRLPLLQLLNRFLPLLLPIPASMLTSPCSGTSPPNDIQGSYKG